MPPTAGGHVADIVVTEGVGAAVALHSGNSVGVGGGIGVVGALPTGLRRTGRCRRGSDRRRLCRARLLPRPEYRGHLAVLSLR